MCHCKCLAETQTLLFHISSLVCPFGKQVALSVCFLKQNCSVMTYTALNLAVNQEGEKSQLVDFLSKTERKLPFLLFLFWHCV